MKASNQAIFPEIFIYIERHLFQYYQQSFQIQPQTPFYKINSHISRIPYFINIFTSTSRSRIIFPTFTFGIFFHFIFFNFLLKKLFPLSQQNRNYTLLLASALFPKITITAFFSIPYFFISASHLCKCKKLSLFPISNTNKTPYSHYNSFYPIGKIYLRIFVKFISDPFIVIIT